MHWLHPGASRAFSARTFCISVSRAASLRQASGAVAISPSVMIVHVSAEATAGSSMALARPISAPVNSFCKRTVTSFFSAIMYPAQSRIFPSMLIVTTCHGMNFPLACSAFFAAISRPPQHGTSIRTMVTLWMSLFRMISVSFSL